MPPCLGMNGGFAMFVMACSGGVGEGVPIHLTAVTKTHSQLQFHACLLAQAMSINASWNNTIERVTTTTGCLFWCVFSAQEQDERERTPEAVILATGTSLLGQ